MPEVCSSKKRRGTASLFGRTTRVPPREYYKGLGEKEMVFDSGPGSYFVGDGQSTHFQKTPKKETNDSASMATAGGSDGPPASIRFVTPTITVNGNETEPPNSHPPTEDSTTTTTTTTTGTNNDTEKRGEGSKGQRQESSSKSTKTTPIQTPRKRRRNRLLAELAPYNNLPNRDQSSTSSETPSESESPVLTPRRRKRTQRLLAQLAPFNNFGKAEEESTAPENNLRSSGGTEDQQTHFGRKPQQIITKETTATKTLTANNFVASVMDAVETTKTLASVVRDKRKHRRRQLSSLLTSSRSPPTQDQSPSTTTKKRKPKPKQMIRLPTPKLIAHATNTTTTYRKRRRRSSHPSSHPSSARAHFSRPSSFVPKIKQEFARSIAVEEGAAYFW